MTNIRLSKLLLVRIVFTFIMILLVIMSILLFRTLDWQHTLVLVLFTLLVFVLAYLSLDRQLHLSSAYLQQKKKAVDDLEEMNLIYHNAEEVACLGSWQLDLHTNMFRCSENLFRVYGSEPRAEEVSFERFLSFVLPEDRELLVQSLQDAIKSQTPTEVKYRIVRSDGVTRYIRTIGKLIDVNGSMIMLGATQDITEITETNEKLSLLNKELQQSYEELSSFNFIASHDLQEPLRKIQTFVSFLGVSEKGNLSEAGRLYLERMQVAASQVRMLIQDILSYSNPIKPDDVWGPVDLNEILQKAMQELQKMIAEKQAGIESEKLPVIQGYTFAMQKVFEHLLHNSIKYNKPGTVPDISVTYELATNKDRLIPGLTPGAYHKICFSDKGIGFEPEYAGKIFDLFQRLHSKSEYEGSGVGLAICKKIVRIHDGTIEALGIPGEGAVFDVYLPMTLGQ
jgi:PAS domain S-box-containing protein